MTPGIDAVADGVHPLHDRHDGDGDVAWAALTAEPAPVAVAETRLVRALLVDAIEIYLRRLGATDREGRRELAEVRRWFASEDRRWPFAFVNVCEVLGLDPRHVRRALRAARDARLARRGCCEPPVTAVDSGDRGPVISRMAC